MCRVLGCDNESSRMAPVNACFDIVSDVLGSLVESMSNIKLCNSHYQKLYKIINSPEPCSSCGERPRFNARQYFYRHCPDPVYISKYMKDIEGINTTITTGNSIVCHECYKKHYRLLQTANQGELKSDLSDIACALESSATTFN